MRKNTVKVILLAFIGMFMLVGCGSDKPELTKEESQMLAFGGILATRNEDPSLTLASNNPDSKGSLADYWEVTDAASAKETLDWLINEGHRTDGNEVLMILKNGEESDYDLGDNVKAQFDACNAMFEEMGISQETVEKVKTIGAWDYDRIVNVARWSYDAEYLTEQEAWDYIKKAKELAIDDHASWEEYFVANTYGRSIAYDGDPQELKETGLFLLNEKDSLWKANNYK